MEKYKGPVYRLAGSRIEHIVDILSCGELDDLGKLAGLCIVGELEVRTDGHGSWSLFESEERVCSGDTITSLLAEAVNICIQQAIRDGVGVLELWKAPPSWLERGV